MKSKLILAIMLIGLSIQQCTIGCLRCNALNQCQLCDITNNYFLSGTTCQLSTQTNCNLISQAGSCVLCNSNFYLDVNSQKCLAVSTANLVSNCQTYNSGQICTSCSGNFFLTAGRCSAVNITVTNCLTYSANGQCMTCTSGFIIGSDFSSCVALPTNVNCLYYTFVGCRSCNAGFMNNPNLYFINFLSASYINSMFLSPMVISLNTWIPLSVCQAVIIANCVVFSSFNFCTQCSPNFFLQNGNCIAFPLPVIFGCLTYSTLTTCIVCQPGMFLSQNTCQNNGVIANCLTYSGSASITTCVACNNNFFLQGNACVVRTLSLNINNCAATMINADLCASCSSGFVLTSDSRACLPLIANCQTYSSSTFQSTTLQCSLCNNGFYVTSSGSVTVCTSGSVANCMTYTVNANTCTICQNGFYLANNICNAHVTIANCLTYDPTKQNFCAVCTTGFYNFAFTTVCVQTTVKAGCSTYSIDGNSCIACQSTYYLNNGSCNLIPSTYSNCASFSGTQCTICNTGYMVNTLPTVGTCILPLDYISAASNSPCSVLANVVAGVTPTWTGISTSSAAPLTCAICNNYMYGYTPKNSEAICVNANQLALNNGFSTITSCKRYGLNYLASPNIVCMECNSGFFISGYQLNAFNTVSSISSSTVNGISCTSTCSFTTAGTTSSFVIPDDLLGFVNICIPPNTVAGTAAATNIFSNPGNCQRYGRYQAVTQLATGGTAAFASPSAINDYVCFLSAPNSSGFTIPRNGLYFGTGSTDGAVVQASAYLYEIYTLATPVIVSTGNYDFTVGYSNTVDSSSIIPNVFNYKGLNKLVFNENYGTFENAAAGLPTLSNNNLQNCDIYYYWKATLATVLGLAFDKTVPFYPDIISAQIARASCFRCTFGFQLSYGTATSQAANANFPSCVQMSNCASQSTVYGGLPTFFNTIFSCHSCQQSGANAFPTVWIETDAVGSTGNFVGYSTRAIYTSATVLDSNHGFRCAAAPTTVVTADAISANLAPTMTAVSNCAAYASIQPIKTYAAVGVTGVTVLEAITPPPSFFSLCVACAANYWPTYLSSASPPVVSSNSKLPGWTVTGCTASVNCDISVTSQFNSCGKCRTDQSNLLVPVYYGFLDHLVANCYQATSQYCFILSPSSFSTTAKNACLVCLAGYYLNSDSFCEILKVPNQSVNNGVFVNSYFASTVYSGNGVFITTVDLLILRRHYLLSFKQLQYGVNSCTSGWVQAPANPWAPTLCVLSSYVYNNTGSFPTTSNFINNCIRYNLTTINNKNVCGGCNPGFIPTIDGLSCVSNAGLPNCVFAQTGSNTGLCYQCIPTLFNVNGICVSTTIPNCNTYVNTPWSFSGPGTLQCSGCFNGFFLSNDFLTCSPGNVTNCITYVQGQTNTCTACTNGWVLLSLTAVYYCYPIPSALNCAFLQDTSSTSGANYATISCATCLANNNVVYGARTFSTLGLTAQPQTLCMPFTPITNCIVYSQSNLIIKSNTFSCLQCANGFWFSISTQTCTQRLNQPSQCISYSLFSDTCLACNSGSFISANGQQCINFPNGIFQCNQYSSATTCIQCNAGFFLSNNACVASTLIPNCAIYSANFTCSMCSLGFFLNNSTSCIVPSATNCLTYTSASVCASCVTGWGLQTTGGVTSCVVVSLSNCVSATNVSPFTCLVCNTGFFPNSNGVCTAVAQTIANCITYDSATTCSVCSPSTILNVARTVCNNTAYSNYIDPNCAQSFLTATPSCTECALGSFFSNGTCISCSNNTLASGCLSCDPLNNNVCLACRPTFYMNSQGGCIAINPSPTPPTPIPPIPSSVSVMKVITLSIALVTVYFDEF